MQDFKKLRIWKEAHSLAVEVYTVSRTFPKEELYGLTSQIRRAAASVPANIAEGAGRSTNADFTRFLYIAMGSASELESLLLLSRDVGHLPISSSEELIKKIRVLKRMIGAMIQKTQS